MRLTVVSHKVCWRAEHSPSGYATDGGFPRQIEVISELFDESRVVVPVRNSSDCAGTSPILGRKVSVCELSVPPGTDLGRKLMLPFWLLRCGRTIWREIKLADAVHAPIPGDVGTIGVVFALLQKKPLFVRHCGNWLVQRTVAERFWKWLMEHFAGGRNVMLATGGTAEAPSKKNANVRWIFSTSLRQREIEAAEPREMPRDGRLKLIIACRQEQRKGTDIVIRSLPLILKQFPQATLDIVGGGSLLSDLKSLAASLALADRVTFHGKVEQQKVVELIKASHVFCFPTSASEGFPKVVLEALGCGIPVITTRVSVLPQLMENGGGILLESATAENLAEAVKDLCSDPGEYQRTSARAAETARQYSLEAWRDMIGHCLQQAWNVPSLSSF